MGTTAKRIRGESIFRGGLEGLLDGAAWTLLSLGVLAAIVVVPLFRLWGLLAALGILANAFLLWLFLRALAELIRIQKKAAGLSYGGKITEAKESFTHLCSECGALLYLEDRCDSCHREIDSGESTEPTEKPSQEKDA